MNKTQKPTPAEVFETWKNYVAERVADGATLTAIAFEMEQVPSQITRWRNTTTVVNRYTAEAMTTYLKKKGVKT